MTVVIPSRPLANVYDVEALDIYRFVGARDGDFGTAWHSEMEAFDRGNTEVQYLGVPYWPRQQQVAAYEGNVGKFNYSQASNQLAIDGTMWVGQVGGDEVVIIYRCAADRAAILDGEFAQVIATIDFNAA